MGKRTLTAILVIAGLVVFIGLALGVLGRFYREDRLIGNQEHIRLATPAGEVDLIAKIDTGADLSSVDERLARSLGFTPKPEDRIRVVTTLGVVERDAVRIKLHLSHREVSTLATLADRSGLSTPVLIGRNDLKGFMVDVSRDFIAPPGKPSFFHIFGLSDTVSHSKLVRVMIVIPILAAAVVLLRMLAGVRTFGVFAPTVIAVTLIDLDIFPGIFIYLYLIVFGMAVKTLVINRLHLPFIVELSLIMFVLVALLAAMTALPAWSIISFEAVFFPLIVTSHLVEQASRSMEEHSLPDALFLLGSTLVTALVLAAIGWALIRLSPEALWIVFVIAMMATIAAGNYLGLRLSEVVRFKFLRRTHVHH